MKILIYGLNYYPEIVGTGKYTTELAEYLSIKNNKVRIITANPYYPQWKAKKNFFRKEKIRNCTIFRSPIFVPKNPNGLKRIIHLLSFSLSSIPNLLCQITWGPDLIIVVIPTILISQNILFLKFLLGKKCKIWLHIQDFEIDAAQKLGILKLSFLNQILKNYERFIYSNFDDISTISKDMQIKLKNKITNNINPKIIRNWIDTKNINENLKKNILYKKFKKELNISEKDIVVMYSGSLNKKQDVDLLINTIKSFPKKKFIKWILSIQGLSKNKIINELSPLKNVIITGLQPTNILDTWLSIADIHLLPQKKNVSKLVMPSKLIGILASGRPVVISTTKDTELGKIANKAGIATKPGDTKDFSNAIYKLCKDKNLRNKLGKNAHQIVYKYYDKEKILNNFLKDIEI